ncbi:Protein of unknown function DUF262 [Lutibacter oricola]|uniref:GmrSD restriction endonucleases N-terminal domain-containing protein n=1 Tax=Lutibacter oricola TaxID=762486 RepID=A0A1H3CNK5_9FLAO|nr:DUF262 domain-containing protein [Lutibacter oricola]SDX55019.1 Protein of unknown function DUF262 [Lutibacter oricola]
MLEKEIQITENALLEPKLVSNIKGDFFIPAYQRGYRWEPEHVEMLLNDIWENKEKNYCLQPIVVKKLAEEKFELIDGQQRSTTLFLIYKYMKQILPHLEINFSLSYETRPKSEEFLKNLNEGLAEDNIDFFYISNAYKAIEEWFKDDRTGTVTRKASKFSIFFDENVKVIWYEVNTNENATNLFTRLNIGKIPLTNAELVKAQFLSKSGDGINHEKQLEIATSWDTIENELRNNDFWAFLTNKSANEYPTRIELLFDLMSEKKSDSRDKFHTFYHFSNEIKEHSALGVWKDILKYYLVLKEWYQKRELYHKVGYLVAIGKSLQTIIQESKELTKTQFKESLDSQIKEELDLSVDQVFELSYDNKNDYYKIDKILLLFNVETVRLLQNSTEMYSFENYKSNNWSLEHIHAQQSEGLNKKEDQQEWLTLHKKSLNSVQFSEEIQQKVNELVLKIDENYNALTKEIFDGLFVEVFELLSDNSDRSYVDSMSNMALLSVANNAALNNATFDVKRNRILEMDKNGEYIPICTRRVFLKYYTNSLDHQLHFWGEEDRKAYINAMIGEEGVITKYLKPNAIIE